MFPTICNSSVIMKPPPKGTALAPTAIAPAAIAPETTSSELQDLVVPLHQVDYQVRFGLICRRRGKVVILLTYLYVERAVFRAHESVELDLLHIGLVGFKRMNAV